MSNHKRSLQIYGQSSVNPGRDFYFDTGCKAHARETCGPTTLAAGLGEKPRLRPTEGATRRHTPACSSAVPTPVPTPMPKPEQKRLSVETRVLTGPQGPTRTRHPVTVSVARLTSHPHSRRQCDSSRTPPAAEPKTRWLTSVRCHQIRATRRLTLPGFSSPNRAPSRQT